MPNLTTTPNPKPVDTRATTPPHPQTTNPKWDQQIAHDFATGKWNKHLKKAMHEHRAGQTRKL